MLQRERQQHRDGRRRARGPAGRRRPCRGSTPTKHHSRFAGSSADREPMHQSLPRYPSRGQRHAEGQRNSRDRNRRRTAAATSAARRWAPPGHHRDDEQVSSAKQTTKPTSLSINATQTQRRPRQPAPRAAPRQLRSRLRPRGRTKREPPRGQREDRDRRTTSERSPGPGRPAPTYSQPHASYDDVAAERGEREPRPEVGERCRITSSFASLPSSRFFFFVPPSPSVAYSGPSAPARTPCRRARGTSPESRPGR